MSIAKQLDQEDNSRELTYNAHRIWFLLVIMVIFP